MVKTISVPGNQADSRARPKRARGWGVLARPRSIIGLVLSSFGVVALPLIVAIVFAVVYVDRLTEQSETLVLQGVEVTRYSRRLSTLLTAMERSARQYNVLHSPALVHRFSGQVREFDRILTALGSLELDTVPDWNLDALGQQSQKLAQWMAKRPRDVQGAITELTAMRRETDLISIQGNLFVDRELDQLQATAAHARIFLLLCVFALIPGALALTAFFAAVIAKPLRQISAAVTDLGDGDFSREIQVAAPTREMDALGARLDWMRRRLATLDNEKQQFIRHMSHELKTPLASIREGAELLRDGTVGELDPAQTEVADILAHSSLELASLIENLLDFAAWRQQRATLNYERFDLTALAEGIVARQRLTINTKQLAVTLPAGPLEITADRDRMHLIMDNLLANAVKFSPRRARVTIDATRADRGTHLRVADQGPGIAPADRARVFEAFYQGSDSADGDAPVRGTGIGLSVVFECVRAHRGRIHVEDAEAGGAAFCLYIPDRHAP